jgi:hypothetical protein
VIGEKKVGGTSTRTEITPMSICRFLFASDQACRTTVPIFVRPRERATPGTAIFKTLCYAFGVATFRQNAFWSWPCPAMPGSVVAGGPDAWECEEINSAKLSQDGPPHRQKPHRRIRSASPRKWQFEKELLHLLSFRH